MSIKYSNYIPLENENSAQTTVICFGWTKTKGFERHLWIYSCLCCPSKGKIVEPYKMFVKSSVVMRLQDKKWEWVMSLNIEVWQMLCKFFKQTIGMVTCYLFCCWQNVLPVLNNFETVLFYFNNLSVFFFYIKN